MENSLGFPWDYILIRSAIWLLNTLIDIVKSEFLTLPGIISSNPLDHSGEHRTGLSNRFLILLFHKLILFIIKLFLVMSRLNLGHNNR